MSEHHEHEARIRHEERSAGWIDILLGGMFSSLNAFADRLIDSIDETLGNMWGRLMRRTFLFFVALLGIAFLLFGCARLFSYAFQVPGLGETVMGIFLLLVAFIFYRFGETRP